MKKILGTVTLVGTLLGTTASAGDMCMFYHTSMEKDIKKASVYYLELKDYTMGCFYHKMSLDSAVSAISVCPPETIEPLKKVMSESNTQYKRLCK